MVDHHVVASAELVELDDERAVCGRVAGDDRVERRNFGVGRRPAQPQRRGILLIGDGAAQIFQPPALAVVGC